MLTILFSLIALITPVDDDFPVLNVIGDSDTFSVRHIDYQQLKDEKKWGVIRKYMLMKKKGELFRDYLPRKIRESMISDTSYFAVKKGERGVPQKMVKVKQFKLREGFAVNKLLPGLKGKDNQKGHTIFKLLSNAKSGGVEVWCTHLENGIHLYSFSEEGLNKSLKILDNRKVKLIAAVKEAIELVEDKPGIWVIMNGANNQNESYRGTVTLIGYLLGNEDNQLSLISATSFKNEKQLNQILDLRKKELMPGSGGQMMKLLDDVQTVIEGNFVVSRGYFGKKYWQRYQKEVEQGQKKIDERSRLRIDSYKKAIKTNKAYIKSPGADPEKVKIAKETVKQMEEDLKKWKEMQKTKKK